MRPIALHRKLVCEKIDLIYLQFSWHGRPPAKQLLRAMKRSRLAYAARRAVLDMDVGTELCRLFVLVVAKAKMDELRAASDRTTEWPADGQFGSHIDDVTSTSPSDHESANLVIASSPAMSYFIIHPQVIENLARQLLSKKSKESACVLRYIMWASLIYGSSWFNASTLYKLMNPHAPKALPTGTLGRLIETGLVIHRQSGNGHECRINVSTEDISTLRVLVPRPHPHGKTSLQILHSFERYFKSHRKCGPLVLLLLVGIHHLHYRRCPDLRDYAAPHQPRHTNEATTSHVLMKMVSEGVLVDCTSTNNRDNGGLIVAPVLF